MGKRNRYYSRKAERKARRQRRKARVSGQQESGGKGYSIVSIQNDGPEIVSTNYWKVHARDGGPFHYSINHRCFRVLVNRQQADEIRRELKGIDHVVVSRGSFYGIPSLEFLFEDGTDRPYSMTTTMNATLDFSPSPKESGRMDLRCIVYGPGLEVLADFTARFRVVGTLPCLKPWGRR